MDERKKGEQAGWPFVKISPELLDELHQEAQMSGLIPSRVKRGQSAVKQGVINLIVDMLRERQKKRKRKEGKE